MNSSPLLWIQYIGRGYLANQTSSTNVAIFSAFLLVIATISGQLDPSSIIVTAQILTVFVCVATPSSASTESNSQGLITLTSLSGIFPSFTTFVSFISELISHLPVISLQRFPIPGHVKLALTLSSSLLESGCWRVPWYHSRRICLSNDGSQILCCPSCHTFVQRQEFPKSHIL